MDDLSLLLLGTGTSSCVPSVACLTANESSKPGCYCCLSTTDPTNPHGHRNIRRNTAALLSIPSQVVGERRRSLLIDCGKSFYAAALEHWPKRGLREIDAVLLTHPHADAILGLDDLRGWTLHGSIQKSIEIWCNQITFDSIEISFPYLTDVKKATGGGDVPQFAWKIFDDTKPFEILGVRVTPLPVHHGKFFSTPPTPYFCLGFLFDSKIAYLSDVSFVPEAVWDLIAEECTLPSDDASPLSGGSAVDGITNGVESLQVNGSSCTGANGGEMKKRKPRLAAMIIDCLRLEQHMSHFGFPQAVATARRSGAKQTYLLGFGHMISHENWLAACLPFTPPTAQLSSSPSAAPAANPTPSNSTPSLPLLPLQYSSTAPHVLIPEPQSTDQWRSYGGTSDPGVENREIFAQEAIWRVRSWSIAERARRGGRELPCRAAEGEDGVREEERGGEDGRDGTEGKVWVRPGCDGLMVDITGSKTEEGEYDVVDDVYS